MPKKLKFFVSTENKILLHLKRFVKVESTKKVPQDIIQVGIATRLGSPRGSVSRALGNLIQKGLVEERLCRVEASKRRMNAYFLSWEGRSQVDELEQKLAVELIEARTDDGTLNEHTIAEALDMSDDPISISELLRVVETEGFYDPSIHKPGSVTEDSSEPHLAKRPTATAGTGTAVSGSKITAGIERIRPPGPPIPGTEKFTKLPAVRTFYGRKDELEELSASIMEHPVVIVKGMAGIGKTTLTAKLMAGYDPSHKIFWYRMQEWDTARGILQAFAGFFNEAGHPDLQNELNTASTELDMFRTTRIILKEFQALAALMVFDDFHRAGESVRQLITGLIEQIESGSQIHMVFISRTHIPIYDQRDVSLKKIVNEVELKGLDRDSAKLLLGQEDIPEVAFNRLYNMTRGHPLALELIRFTGHVSDISDMMRFINEQVFQKLKKDEKALLSALSVHRRPAPIPAFLLEEEADFDTVDELINRTLLVEVEAMKYDLHDLIKEFLGSRLIAKNRERYHRHAAQYYSSTEAGESTILEAVYHYINAGEQDLAAELMVTRAPPLISRGQLDEAMNILTKFDSNVSTEYLARLYTLKGDILSTWGEWDNVFEYYWQCYFIAMIEKVEMPKWQLLGSFGLIGWKPSEVEVAVKNLNSSIDVLKDSGDTEGMLEIENSLAWLNWMTGSYKDAESSYKKLQKKKEEEKDIQGAAKMLIKLGNVYWADSKLEPSIKTYKKGLELFTDISDQNGMARTYSHLALVHMELGEHEKVDEMLEQCIQIAEQRQYKRGLAFGLMHKAQQFILQGKYEDARSMLKRSKTVFEGLNDPLGLGFVDAQSGFVLKLTEDHKGAIEHFESTLNHMRGFLMPYYKSRIYTELCKLYKLSGDTEKAEECQQHAIEKGEQKEE